MILTTSGRSNRLELMNKKGLCMFTCRKYILLLLLPNRKKIIIIIIITFYSVGS